MSYVARGVTRRCLAHIEPMVIGSRSHAALLASRMARPNRAPAASPQINVVDLPLECQRAWELLDALQGAGDLRGAFVVLRAAGTEPPVGPQGLARVAATLGQMGMPLTNQGLRRFKAERALTGGNAITVPVAKAFVRAIKGRETLFRVARLDLMGMSAHEHATYEFLKKYARVKGTEAVHELKRALKLGNPKLAASAAKLENEYVGVTTIKELAAQVYKAHVPLTPNGMNRMMDLLDPPEETE